MSENMDSILARFEGFLNYIHDRCIKPPHPKRTAELNDESKLIAYSFHKDAYDALITEAIRHGHLNDEAQASVPAVKIDVEMEAMLERIILNFQGFIHGLDEEAEYSDEAITHLASFHDNLKIIVDMKLNRGDTPNE